MAGLRLWAYQDTSLEQPHLKSFDTVQSLVDSVLEAIVFESDLRVRYLIPLALTCASRLEWTCYYI